MQIRRLTTEINFAIPDNPSVYANDLPSISIPAQATGAMDVTKITYKAISEKTSRNRVFNRFFN